MNNVVRIFKISISKKYINKSFLFFSLLLSSVSNAQTPATEAYGHCPKCTTNMDDAPPVYITDGYWFSNNNTNNARIANATNQLIGFKTNNTVYSTGVNNALLTSKNVTYSAQNYKAFPIRVNATTASNHFIGLPKWDENGVYRTSYAVNGVNTTFGSAPPCNVPRENYMRDGTNGLDISTLLFNIPKQEMTFNVDVLADINPACINDDIPDIVVTQMGAPPTGGGQDQFKFTDASGNQVGNLITVTLSGIFSVGRGRYALYHTEGTCSPTGNHTFNTGYEPWTNRPAPDNALRNSTATSGNGDVRDTRILTFKLSDFGINLDPSSPNYYTRAVKFVHVLSGDSDPAFTAYNTSSLNVYCYEDPTVLGTALDTNMGITAIGRAGAADADNWPMDRKGGWMALESNKKPLVITRGTTTEINNITNPVEGMLVFDTVVHCMKMYVNSTTGWRCFNRKTCP